MTVNLENDSPKKERLSKEEFLKQLGVIGEAIEKHYEQFPQDTISVQPIQKSEHPVQLHVQRG